MASLAVFTPYTDQENTTDAGMRKIRSKSDSAPPRAHAGKIFQSGISQTPLRRALGVVNRSNELKPNAPQQQKPQQKTFDKPGLSLQPPAPASKLPKPKMDKPKVAKRPVVMAKEVLGTQDKVVIYVDEIEKMPLSLTEEIDDFENIWPSAERPATYIPQLKEWRGWSLCPSLDTETDAEDEKDWEFSDDEDEMTMTITEPCGERPRPVVPMPSGDDVPLPSWEEIFGRDDTIFTLL